MGKEKAKFPEFGRRLRTARKALGVENAKDFADSLRLNQQTYGNYERGSRFPDPDVLALFAEHGMSLDYLILGRGPVLRIERNEKAG